MNYANIDILLKKHLNCEVGWSSNFNSWENIVGKGENTGNQHFLLFP